MALTRAWTQLRPHDVQSQLWRSSARFVAVAAGRGSGKTELARRRAVRYLPVVKPWADPIYFYALPTVAQAKRVAWRPLKQLIPREWIKRINESELYIETVFGSTLFVLGMDKPQRAEGVQWDGGVIDEACDQKPGTFNMSFLPAFSHRKAWCWQIGVPKRQGVGCIEFKKAWNDWGADTSGQTASFTWTSDTILPAEDLEWARQHLDQKDFSEQYMARWEDIAGQVFYAFSEVLNVSNAVSYDPALPICVGSDFNVDPMAWVIGHQDGDGIRVFDELWLRNTNTAAALGELYSRYQGHTAGWEFYGDATGRARKTSAASTDYIQIKNDRRFRHAKVYYRRANPPIAVRFAATNALVCNAASERRVMIHPRCIHLIEDLRARNYRAGSREPDDYGDLGHITDALGYWIHRRFPIRLTPTHAAPHVQA